MQVSYEFLLSKINRLENEVEELKKKTEAVENWSYTMTSTANYNVGRIHNIEKKVHELEKKVDK